MRKGSHHSPSARRRMSEATRKRMADPSLRRRISEARGLAWKRERDLEPGLRETIGVLRRLKGAVTRKERKRT